MEGLDDLYQEIILQHNKRPRNEGELAEATHDAEGYNPLCGDRIHVYLLDRGGRWAEVRFTGESCAIARASASLMTVALKEKERAETDQIIQSTLELLNQGPGGADPLSFGELGALLGVRKFPARIKCATLAWHTAREAMDQ